MFTAAVAFAQPTDRLKEASDMFRAATEDYRANRLDAAIEKYTQYLKIRPDAASAWYNRGLAYRERAERAIIRADFEKAEADFSQAIKIDPKDADHWLYRGLVRRMLLRVDYSKADGGILDLSEAIRLNPSSAAAYSGRGQIYAEKNDHKKALPDLDRAIQLNSSDYVAYFTRGKISGYNKDYSGSRSDMEAALRLQPSYEAARIFLKYINEEAAKNSGAKTPVTTAAAVTPAKPVTDIGDGYKEAEEAEKTGNNRLVVDIAARAIQGIPMIAARQPADNLITSVYLRLLQKKAKANSALGKYVDSDADYYTAVLAAMNNTSRDMEAANKRLAGDRTGMGGGDIMAGVEAAKGVIICKAGMEIGLEWINAVEKTRPKDLAVGITAGMSLAGLREVCSLVYQLQGGTRSLAAINNKTDRLRILNEAITAYTEAIKLTPKDPRPYAGRAKLYRDTGRADLAAADEQKVRELPPRP
ncbi:MAG: tetratricopeptide repeat protein [Pyrinomonadaceae bacterium]